MGLKNKNQVSVVSRKYFSLGKDAYRLQSNGRNLNESWKQAGVAFLELVSGRYADIIL